MDELNYVAERQYLAAERSAGIEELHADPDYYEPRAMGAANGQ